MLITIVSKYLCKLYDCLKTLQKCYLDDFSPVGTKIVIFRRDRIRNTNKLKRKLNCVFILIFLKLYPCSNQNAWTEGKIWNIVHISNFVLLKYPLWVFKLSQNTLEMVSQAEVPIYFVEFWSTMIFIKSSWSEIVILSENLSKTKTSVVSAITFPWIAEIIFLELILIAILKILL